MKKVAIALVSLVGIGGFIVLISYKPQSSTPSGGTTTGTAATATAKGPFKDGSYTGTAIDTPYGVVQVSATVASGKITGVTWLQTPSDRSRSQEISNAADPQLVSEALTVQSAAVDTISGASSTSAGFVQSLDSALTQAQA